MSIRAYEYKLMSLRMYKTIGTGVPVSTSTEYYNAGIATVSGSYH